MLWRPSAELVVHLDGHDIGSGAVPAIARVEGHGPHARFTIRPVLDPLGQVPVDAHEIPPRHRRAVRLISPADIFPFASCTSVTMLVDHTGTRRIDHAA